MSTKTPPKSSTAQATATQAATAHGQQPVISARERRLIEEFKEAREIKTDGLLANWDGKDFRKYKWTMLTVMREHGLDDIALRKLRREELVTEEGKIAFDRKQFTIMRFIGTTLPTDKFQQVDHIDNGPDMWEWTCEIYEKRSDPTIRKSIIVKKMDELRSLKCVAAEDIDGHLAKMFRLRTELASYNYTIHDINMKEMMFESLPDLYEFEQLRGAIKYGGNGGQLQPEGLRALMEQGAQTANGCAGLTLQWIADRGGWSLSSTNKAFQYIFNTTQEDQKVAKVLSGWDAKEPVAVANLAGFDSLTRSKLDAHLFACCSNLQTASNNINPAITDILCAHLIKAFPEISQKNTHSPLVARVESAIASANVVYEELLAWSTKMMDAWERVSAALGADDSFQGERGARSCRSRFMLLVRHYKDGNRTALSRNATDDEFDEKMQLLDDIVDKMDSHAETLAAERTPAHYCKGFVARGTVSVSGDERVRYVNRLLAKIAKPAGAQTANGCPDLTLQWIADRGGWSLSSTNKAFQYIFNTTQEDQKVAKVLSGWDAKEPVAVANLSGFDSLTRSKLDAVKAHLFACCSNLQTATNNINPAITDILCAHLIKAFPEISQKNPHSPLVARVESAIASANVVYEELLAWSVHLAQHVTASEITGTRLDSKEAELLKSQAAVIEELLCLTQTLSKRLKDVEALLEDPAKRKASLMEVQEEPVMPKPPKKARKAATDVDTKKKSDSRNLVAYMNLFAGEFALDEASENFRDEVLALATQTTSRVHAFFDKHGVRARSTGTALKAFLQLHRELKLNEIIVEYTLRVRAGVVVDPTPSTARCVLFPVNPTAAPFPKLPSTGRMAIQRTQPNAICTAPEFMNLFMSKLREINSKERKFYFEDKTIRHLSLTMLLTIQGKEFLAGALGVLLLDITSKMRRGHGDDSKTEWVADQSLEERPLYGVRRILDRKREDGVVNYLVDWQPTWETRNDVGSTLIVTFEKARRALVRKTFIEDEAVEAGK
ncbi:hypothetical protein ATCC90586_000770 [Pythium insidiosum]|nr:hypothetical protein ATCC90586_000770 [Pythium insidiosum]